LDQPPKATKKTSQQKMKIYYRIDATIKWSV